MGTFPRRAALAPLIGTGVVGLLLTASVITAQTSVVTTVTPSPTTVPVGDAPRAGRALIVSIDGLRPDVMLRADAPVLRSLMAAGSFTMWARTTEASVTLPSHASMLTGVRPERHGVDWNGDLKPEEQRYPLVPTLLDRARAAGMSTALVAGKSKFVALAREGTVDHVDITGGGSDTDVAVAAERIVRDYRPRVMVVHFPATDGAGHGVGWGTPEQIDAIQRADAALGRVLGALTDAGVRDETLVIVSTDHGGAGRTHGPDDPRSRHIPWICVGPGVRANHDLTTHRDLVVNTEDTFATAAWMLGIPVEPGLDGRPVVQVLAERELLESE